ncbi:MAG: O-methyltransferase [Thermoleophilaceae bacterium]|jgi:O-methyltransferase|nr:O-methyltransferase [Thermoleophilaceae bacterium]MEA2400579.1 O-methyltransferase [Thermoleophilaceae bacterium]
MPMSTVLNGVRARIPAVRGRILRPLVRFREMRFPTFPREVHESIATSDDYFRHATLGLAAQRVLDERVEGAFAEVGVWRGETSSLLHRLAPERRLYLFDTFTGFPDADLPPGATDARFRDTSEQAVRRRVGPSQNVVLRPGYVPETLVGLEDERFAFVLLDLDLIEPTRASLEFFYPRLSAGGYLVMHDYNNPESDWACKRAFDAFLADRPEQLVELGDVWGSALIRRMG